ncbi:PHB depolymerase family esterase [Amycolatopsis sp. YIM 10]|uniref:extracellular catalytic domain type 1 short-chain-length polyhydroxyalkanoate depolymerase n=1 Tax=Amycolatopsis sp. YIM 10 TaxID=2653857 RepID=UPI00129006A6|nr:PHB depolymerase family esterase [Amycolatopsis sp. YIM 10]QFU92036.1 Exoglucanase/xylanase precursor [Amycolatopsis sp. YIM 10]
MRILGALLAAAMLVTGLSTAPPASAAALTEVTNFGPNPSGLRMHVYVPDQLRPKPPVLLAVHWCTGSGPAMFSGTDFAQLADQHGFVVVYPSATRSGNCFDVSSPQALKRDGGSDPVGMASMVRHALQTYQGDASRVFVTGISSGAMTTNVMLANYPDIFAAGAAFSGVPASCFATTDGSGWNSQCANGLVLKTPRQWGDLARAAYPGYSGPRPRMQLWHGTQDETLRYPNFGEEIDQWTDVHGLSTTPTTTDYPRPNWTRTRYGTGVEAISLQGVSHNLWTSGMGAEAVRFFGLDQGGGPGPVADCQISYRVNAWNTGLTASVTITNTGTTPLNGWNLVYTLPAGQDFVSGWNAVYTKAGSTITAKNPAYQPVLPAGGSVEIGFQAGHTGDTGEPAAFTLNGTACAVS